MSWSMFDDRYDENDKIADAWEADRATVGLHAMATTACSRWESDGVIRPRWLTTMLPNKRERERILGVMVEIGLFDLLRAGETMVLEDRDGESIEFGPFDEDRYVVHGYLKFHDSAAKRARNREWDRRRKELERDRDLVTAIRERDRDRCRYCGLQVNWRDRRSPKGGTYDHVIPRGDNSLENVVVACRGCNNRKGPRTPEQARMPLLAPGQIDPSQIKPGSGPRPDRSQVGSSHVQATRPDPTRPDQRTPQPPQAGELPDLPIPPSGGRARERERFTDDIAAYAAARFPDVTEPHRSQLVRVAIGSGATTHDAVAEYVRQWGPQSSTPQEAAA